MNKEMKKLIELNNEVQEVEKDIENSIREHLTNKELLICVHATDLPHPSISFWLWEKQSKVSMRFTIHDTHASTLLQGSYSKDTCEEIKQALDNWLKEKANA